jgi:hypothetical protein
MGSITITDLDSEKAIKALIRLGIPGRYAEEAVADADVSPGSVIKPWKDVQLIKVGKTYTVKRI